jgi:hypothetical protein
MDAPRGVDAQNAISHTFVDFRRKKEQSSGVNPLHAQKF